MPYQVQDLHDFLEAIGIQSIDKGHDTLDPKKWKAHKNRYGTNKVSSGYGKFRWQYSNMPFLYGFLSLIAAGVMCADKMLYEYEYWYI